MAWLDYWLSIPWVLYDGTALRVLVAAAAAIVVMVFSPRLIRA